MSENDFVTSDPINPETPNADNLETDDPAADEKRTDGGHGSDLVDTGDPQPGH